MLACSPIHATTWYVNKSGSDGNSCVTAQSPTDANAKLTIAAGIACASGGGDVVSVGDGTYVENLISGWKAGTTFSNKFQLLAKNSRGAIIRPASGNWVLQFTGSATKYIEINGFVLDGTNVAIDGIKIQDAGGSYANHIRIKDCEVKNALHNNGILIASQSPGNEIINCDIHDNGDTDFDHGIYITSADNLVEQNRIYNNAGWGIHQYTGTSNIANNNIYRKNKIYSNARVLNRGNGMIIGGGNNCQVYNNIVYSNRGGISIQYGSPTGTLVYNNTIYNNNANASGYGIYIDTSSSATVVKNNISYLNSLGNITNLGSGTVQSNQFTSNPSFVNAGSADFRLLAGSSAIGAGTSLSSIFTDDYIGTSRPQGINWDIGAYENISPPAALTLLSPNGGDSVEVGQPLVFLWSANGIGANVDLLLDRTNDGIFEETIVASTPTSPGSYTWPSVTGGASTNVMYKVKDSGAATNDISDAVSTISAAPVTATITMTSPVSGEIWGGGVTIPIRWTPVNVSGNVSIKLSRDNGVTWEVINASTPFNSADIAYAASGASSSVCLIRVTSLNNIQVYGTSSAFRIGGTILHLRLAP